MDSCHCRSATDKMPTAETDEDYDIPFSATTLKHSMSDGSASRQNHSSQPGRNGYRRMHSFHSTLSDNHWDLGEDSSIGSSFLPSDFRDTILKTFPDLRKNGFQSHSFDEDDDIFEDTADRFSCGFFSESEIDDIPRSTLFHRNGLRRSVSNVGPRIKTTRIKPREADGLDQMKSRQSKIDELMRLKKKLEELKGNWKKNETDKGETTGPSQANNEESSKNEDPMDGRAGIVKGKGMQKRRRLSSLKQSQSLSPKVMEELVEEDEQQTDERENFPSQDGDGCNGRLESPRTAASGYALPSSMKSSSDDVYSSRIRDEVVSLASPPNETDGDISPPGVRREKFDLISRTGKDGSSDSKSGRNDPKPSLFKLNGDSSVRRKYQNRSFDEESTSYTDSSHRKCNLQRSASTSYNSRGAHSGANERSHWNTRRFIDRDDEKLFSVDHDFMKSAEEGEDQKEDTFCDRSDDAISRGASFMENTDMRSYGSRNTSWGERERGRKVSSSDFIHDISSDDGHTTMDTKFRRLLSRDGLANPASEDPITFPKGADRMHGDFDITATRDGRDRKDRLSKKHGRLNRDDVFSSLSFPKGSLFEDDFFSRDWKRHQLLEEIGDVQRHLADITKREIGKRRNKKPSDDDGSHSKHAELKRSTSETDLHAQRSNLTGVLKQLLCKKQEREQQIRTRIDKLKSERQQDDTEDTGRKDDTALTDTEDVPTNDIPTPVEASDDDDDVSTVLRRAGAEQFIPIFKKNEITIDKLYQFVPSDFADLDITDPELQRRLQEEIDRHYVEQKNALLRAEESEDPKCVKDSKDKGKATDESASTLSEESAPCSLISSAPEGYEPEVPVHVSAECVVCLDEQSNLLFLNCGHVCCCYDCSINLVLCPLCRAEIESKLIMNDSVLG